MAQHWMRITGALLALTAMTGCGSGEAPSAEALSAPYPAFAVMQSGGMAPSVVSVLQSPSLVIYGDGRVLTRVQAPALQMVPSRYEVADVGAEAVRGFVDTAQSGGLISDATDFGTPRATDLPTTTVMVGAAQVRVYALEEQFEQDLTPAQREARTKLRALITQAGALAAGKPQAPYSPDSVVVFEPVPGRNQEPAAAPWPGPPPSGFLRPNKVGRAIACGDLNGDDARTVYQAALDNPGARWLVDGVTRVLGVNPVPLPGACP